MTASAPRAWPTSSLADGAPDGALDSRIRAIVPTRGPVVGRAVPVLADAGDNGPVREAVELAEPGDVLLVDGGGRIEVALYGGVLGRIARVRGLAAIVVDGAVRDVDELLEFGLPVYAAGVTPRGPKKVATGQVDAGTCGGVAVRRGDIVALDGDGVVVVARDDWERVEAVAQAVAEREAAMITAIEGGATSTPVPDPAPATVVGPNRYEGKVAIVTGGASGIGAATAIRIAAEGGRVVLADIDVERGEGVAAQIAAAGGSGRFVSADVARREDWERVANAALRLGGVDLVVNNAYANVVVSTLELSEEEWRRQLDVNVTQVFHAVQLCMPSLIERRGSMVNVSSVHAHVGFDRHAGYDAGKGALTALTRELAVEFGPQVRVNSVLPGPIITRIWEGTTDAERAASAAMTTLGRNGGPEEVAAVICFLGSADASYVTGAEFVVDGGWLVTRYSR